MSAYLQRLLDRGAGLGAGTGASSRAAPDADVAPATAPGSPAFDFDQRLADPVLARMFSFLGGAPGDAAGDDAQFAHDGRAAVMAAPPSEPNIPARDARAVRPPAVPAGAQPAHRVAEVAPRATLGADPASATAVNGAAVLPVPTRPGTREQAVAQPVAVAGPPAPPAPWVQAPQRAIASGLAASPGEALPATVDARRAAAPQAALVTPPRALADVAASATAATAAALVRPAPAPARPQQPFIRPQPALAGAPQVEPVRRSPAPLAAPVTARHDAVEIERIARDAARAEFARQQAQAAPRSATAVPAESDGAPKPQPRPATAREASVIGELEPSASPLTIYGLRRR